MIITLVGGGSISHTLIPLLSRNGNVVNLLTTKPALWGATIETEYQNENGQIIDKWSGRLSKASASEGELIPTSDIILLTLPVHLYFDALKRILPHIPENREVYLGAIYGQGGLNWMINSLIGNGYRDLCYFTFGLVPWVCRVKAYGVSGITYGPKAVNTIALRYKDAFAVLDQSLFQQLRVGASSAEFRLAENFLSLTLSVDNQIIHTTRLYALMTQSECIWATEAEVPLFYKHYDQYSVGCLTKLDNELDLIRSALRGRFRGHKFTYMLGYLELDRLSYGHTTRSVLDSFVNSKTLARIRTPTVSDGIHCRIDTNHRFFKDDIFNGLVIYKWFAEQLEIDTPFLDLVLKWAESLLETTILRGKSLVSSEQLKTPEYYGYSSLLEAVDL